MAPHSSLHIMGTRPGARHERTEATSTVEEHPVNEDMEMDELLKNWKTQKKTKRN
jgi:hypothetical protein